MSELSAQRQLEAAWDRIESLGGSGVWDADIVAVTFADSGITDDDLAVFRDFPLVQTLDLTNTAIGDEGLAHLAGCHALESLVIVGTKVTAASAAAFRRERPMIMVVTERAASDAVNPFTGRAPAG